MRQTVSSPATDFATKVVETLVNLGIERADIHPEAQLRADLDIDSAELVEVVVSIAGGSTSDGKALKGVRTVAQLQQFLAG